MDPGKLQTIAEMSRPAGITTLDFFLDLISYNNTFLPTQHSIRVHLHNVLRKETKLNLTFKSEKAFIKLKDTLTFDMLLSHYNQNLPIIVAADDSNYDAGEVSFHILPDDSEKAVAHASQDLTKAEKNYNQIEKEFTLQADFSVGWSSFLSVISI